MPAGRESSGNLGLADGEKPRHRRVEGNHERGLDFLAAIVATEGGAREERGPHMTKTIETTGGAGAVLARRDFFRAVGELLKGLLPADYAHARIRTNPVLMKVDFGNERVHYEVAPDTSRGHIEVALHFEDGPISTAAYLLWFDGQIVELKHHLGPNLELERWTASWGRLYELQPLPRLERQGAEQVARRLAAFIVTLQPSIDAARIPPERSALPATERGRWRGSSRGRRSG